MRSEDLPESEEKKAVRPRKLQILPISPSQAEREILARNVRRSRMEMGISQRELSRRTGVAQPHISEIEAAKHNVCLDTMAKIAQIIKMPIYELLKP